MEEDPCGSKLGRVKKKTTLFINNNKFFFKWHWVSREGKGCGASLEQEAGITQLGEFNDLFDRDKAVPIQ